MSTFEVGKTYSTRSIGDHNCIVRVAVVSRTAKTIKAQVGVEMKTMRVSEYRGNEQVKPWGSYSMAPIVDASETAELKADWER